MESVLDLLSQSALTTDGLIKDASLVLVAGPTGSITACAAVEIDGSDGLLRSVAVEADGRGSGVGTQIVGQIENEARKLGVIKFYLLTTTAEPFFKKLGYEVIDRDSVPNVVRESAEFSACALAGAIAMCKGL